MQQPYRPPVFAVILLALAVSGLLWVGCSDVPKSSPPTSSCLDNDDCAGLGRCQMGICVTTSTDKGDGGITKEATPSDHPENTSENTSEQAPDSPCKEGDMRPCFTVKDEQRNKGICKDGLQTCKGGTWDKCVGEITPSSEICDDNLDNNCDGVSDEGCKCQEGEIRPCGESVGECKPGAQTCLKDGVWSTTCDGAIEPTQEICDQKDNDCNGQTDETFVELGRPCFAGLGICEAEGKYICDPITGKTICDAQPKAPSAEKCNNLDDDCDGVIDNVASNGDKPCNLTEPKGECANGQMKCINGQELCTQVNFIQPEVCNGKDDDCDGQIDDDPNGSKLTQSCYAGPNGSAGVGNCKSGTQSCEGGTWSACKGEVIPTTETCDGTDEDCNGLIDDGITDGCACTNGDSEQCGPTGGACVQGNRTCSGGKWGDCMGATGPQPETCDGKDNDCNGTIDDGIPSSSCNVPNTHGPCLQGTTTCTAGKIVCTQTVKPATETCDSKDTNCDGKLDVCKQGDLRCQNGKVERCKSDCEGWEVSVTCKTTERCENNRCVNNCQCTPGQKACGRDWRYSAICKNDCSGYELTQCPSNQRCLNSACRTCICTPGSYRCDPNNERNAQSCQCTYWHTYGSCNHGYECAKNSYGRLYCKKD